jgi:hypothetical protein
VAVAGGGVGGLGGNGGIGGAVVEPPPVPLDQLELWFRADQGVSQAGGVVARWNDMSGNHRDALQTAGNQRPLIQGDALAGKPALVFDGTDDYLKVPGLDVDFAAGVSVFVAMQPAQNTTCEGYFEASNGSEKDDVHVGDWRGSLLYEVEENTVNDTNYPLVLDAPQVAAVVHDTAGFAHVRRNSNGVGEGSVALPPLANRQQVFIGHSLYGDCSPFKGVIGELLVYSRGVSDDELVQIESYLQTKWGCCEK